MSARAPAVLNAVATVLIGLAGIRAAAAETETWDSPDGQRHVALTKDDKGFENGLANAQTGRRYEAVADSVFQRENHGFGWMGQAQPRWMGDRYLVFVDDDGLAVIDTQREKLLLNHVFAGLTPNPASTVWAAVRFRPTTRMQDKLRGDERDTLVLVDPAALGRAGAMGPGSDPFRALKQVRMDGILLAPPLWSADGKRIGVVCWKDGRAEGLVFDAGTFDCVKRQAIEDPFPKEIALNPWFSDDMMIRVGNLIQRTKLLDPVDSP